MNIFSEVKEYLTARQVAENYGLQVRRNGLACCPFHDDKHPSMKIDKNYHCFACGVGGDAIDYVSRMFGLSQYEAALKIVEDFRLPIEVKGNKELSEQDRARIRRERTERERLIHIRERFDRWCNHSIESLRDGLLLIEQMGIFLNGKPPDIIFSEDYARMLHAEPIMNYWLDILCMGSTEDKQELFMKAGRRWKKLQRESESEESVLWNEIGEVLDKEMSTVEDIRADLARNDKGNTCQTINNCMLVFQRDPVLKGAIRKNELSGKIDIVGNLGWQRTSSSLTDTDVYQIHWYLEKNYGLKNDRNINKAMNIVASENKYHPIRECLEKLKWDGQPRIDNLLPRYLGADHDDYTKEIMRLLMLAAIRRVYEPGCKFEIMVCLVGGQGAGKSTFFRFLAINDEWFSDDLKRMDDDNVYRKMQGHWIIEMSEMMATVNAKSIEDIKSFISRQKETYKIPYETHPEDRPRQCVFVGTSNNMDFLPLDRTGNRRFAPVLVHPERVEKHILEDEKESREYIRQAWAEAMELYRNGSHELKLSRETEEYLKEMQKDFMPEDAKVGVIQLWLDELAEDYVCSIMIYKEAFSHEYDTPKDWELKEINNVMNHSIVGWEKVSSHRFAGYGTQRGWRRVAGKNEFQKLPEDAVIPFEER